MWLRAGVVWLLIMIVESVHGILRAMLLEPAFGSSRARQVSVITGCILIFLITLAFVKWIDAPSNLMLVLIGVSWVVLTLVFEFAVIGPLVGSTWERAAEDYDVSNGGLMGFGLIFMAMAPLLTAHLRSGRRTDL